MKDDKSKNSMSKLLADRKVKTFQNQNFNSQSNNWKGKINNKGFGGGSSIRKAGRGN